MAGRPGSHEPLSQPNLFEARLDALLHQANQSSGTAPLYLVIDTTNLASPLAAHILSPVGKAPGKHEVALALNGLFRRDSQGHNTEDRPKVRYQTNRGTMTFDVPPSIEQLTRWFKHLDHFDLVGTAFYETSALHAALIAPGLLPNLIERLRTREFPLTASLKPENIGRGVAAIISAMLEEYAKDRNRYWGERHFGQRRADGIHPQAQHRGPGGDPKDEETGPGLFWIRENVAPRGRESFGGVDLVRLIEASNKMLPALRNRLQAQGITDTEAGLEVLQPDAKMTTISIALLRLLSLTHNKDDAKIRAEQLEHDLNYVEFIAQLGERIYEKRRFQALGAIVLFEFPGITKAIPSFVNARALAKQVVDGGPNPRLTTLRMIKEYTESRQANADASE